VVIVMEVSWKNKIRFVKDVPMVRVNVIIIVLVVPEKREDVTFVQRSCTIELLSL
jgi:hypothetical protein